MDFYVILRPYTEQLLKLTAKRNKSNQQLTIALAVNI